MTKTEIIMFVWNGLNTVAIGYLLAREATLSEVLAEFGKGFREFVRDTKRNLHIVHTQGKTIKTDVEAMRRTFKEFTED
jgi:hypothetical protein